MVNIFDKDIYTRIARIEGDFWLSEQERPSEYTVESAKVEVAKFIRKVEEFLANPPENPEDAAWDLDYLTKTERNAVSVVYGMGGWHRYMVNGSGQVFFSVRHCAQPAKLELARKLGFADWK